LIWVIKSALVILKILLVYFYVFLEATHPNCGNIQIEFNLSLFNYQTIKEI